MGQKRKLAVISGATKGIGLAIAEKLLENGYSLAVCARQEQDLISLQQDWSLRFPMQEVLVLSADFSKKEDVIQFADAVKAQFTAIDILVNNAGVFHPGALIDEPEGQLEATIQLNLYSAYYLTRALMPLLDKGSSIFNICSVASLKAYPNGGSYSISKYALLGFSENLRDELKPKGIRVTAICAGATWTRSWSGAGIDQERFMEAQDIASIILTTHLLSPKTDVETVVMRPMLGDI
ncbi:MAG: SDR family oxidoreductase [Bacteroidetes bacterium]|nr:SDR family oxidoreductase [Bacteroidota bacterium]